MPFLTRIRSFLGRPYSRIALELPAGSSILDVGCGPAKFLRRVAGARDDLVLAGVDLRRAPSLPATVDFARVDLEDSPLPYATGSFQLVVCSHVLEHLSEPQRTVAEIYRVLAPSGVAYLETPSERTLRAPSCPRWLQPQVPLAFSDEVTHVGHPFSPEDLGELARGVGLSVVRVGRARSPGVWAVSPVLLASGCVVRSGPMVVRALEQMAGLSSYALTAR